MTPVEQDLDAIAPGLNRGADGIWRAERRAEVDYPDDANAFCFQVEAHSFWFNYRNRFIVETVRQLPPAGAIADIGAGNGYVSLALQQAGFPTIVIEPGRAGADNARSRGLAPIVCATLQDAGFLPASLPAAGLFDVVEHFADDEGLLREVHDLLKPGGRLYVTVPAFRALWSTEDELVGHHHRYSMRQVSALLLRTGFTVDFATYLFSALVPPLFLLRTLPSRLGRRTRLDATTTAAELQPTPGLMLRAISTLLDGELALIKRRIRIPVGTSCLVAATAVAVRR